MGRKRAIREDTFKGKRKKEDLQNTMTKAHSLPGGSAVIPFQAALKCHNVFALQEY